MKNIQNDQTSTSASIQYAKADIASAKAQRNAGNAINATVGAATASASMPSTATNSIDQLEIQQAKQELNK